MADAYDFTIDTLSFRCATSKQTPYVRSTAPFRKEQFDSSQQAGDQSLTGWWTRGQYSFHKGAGIKYYDVSSEDVLNRYTSAYDVAVWTPGQVTVAPAPSTLTPPTITGGQQYTNVVYTAGHMVSVVADKLYVDGNQVTTLSVPTDIVYGVTVQSEGLVLVATANRIEQGGVNGNGTWSPGPVLWWNTNAGTPGNDAFLGVWWAKDRIWARDGARNWYALALSGGTIPSGGGSYVFWSKGPTSSNIGLVETPGAVLIHDTRYVYSVTLASDGSVPALTSPAVVVDMGSTNGLGSVGIQGVAYARGWLGILTEQTFTAGQVSPDGSVVLGPDLIRFYVNTAVPSAVGRSVVAIRDKMYFVATGTETTTATLYAVNLSDATGALQPTWTQYDTIGSNPGDVRLAANSTGVLVVGYDYTPTVYRPRDSDPKGSTLAALPSGTITTGYHRYGTLEDKQFYSITVSARCTNGGTITVEWVDATGTRTMLGTAGDGKTTLSLAAIPPSAGMAFRFTLKGNPSAPLLGDVTLLGYQIKALPVPKRQRILKVPLVVADRVETRWGRDTGKAGRAWSDLQALEALESSKAIITFTDHRTNETGSAYIDSIDFQGEVPTDRTNGNFGGVAYATLRVVGS